ncbi:hypothetical protein Hanom_Chr07g00606771 [Helianthus anomalus]
MFRDRTATEMGRRRRWMVSASGFSHTQIKEQRICLIGGGNSNAVEDDGRRWLVDDGDGTTT